MRALIFLVPGAVILAGIVVMFVPVYRALNPRGSLAAPATARTNAELATVASDAVRLLEHGAADPLFRQSSDWDHQASRIVTAYYESR